MSLLYGYENPIKAKHYIDNVLSKCPYKVEETRGHLYVAVTKDLELCKIGFSRNPHRRIVGVNSELSEYSIPKMFIVFTTESTLQYELKLHRRFTQYNCSLKQKRVNRSDIWGDKFNGQDGLTEVYYLKGEIYEYVSSLISID